MSLRIYDELEQGTDAWLQARCGIVTASVVGQLITAKTIKPAANDYSRSLTEQLVAERITGHVEPIIPSRAMERGTLDEPYAREAYAAHKGVTVDEVGFMVCDDWGFRIGYSPDGLVGGDGLIEIKSRDPKIQLGTILNDEVPLANMAQIQCGLLVSGRKWLDYVSYSGGMHLYIKRVYPNATWHNAIVEAVRSFEQVAEMMIAGYEVATAGLPLTERIDHYLEPEFT
jgi:hypothetical protein